MSRLEKPDKLQFILACMALCIAADSLFLARNEAEWEASWRKWLEIGQYIEQMKLERVN